MEDNRHNLSKDALSALLYVWACDTSRQPAVRDLQERFAALPGPIPSQPEDPRGAAIAEKIQRQLSDSMAERLLANDRNRPFLTSDEANAIIGGAEIRAKAKELFGDELTDGQTACIVHFAQVATEGVFERVMGLTDVSKLDHYEVWWRQINTLLDISTERKMPPLECLTSAEANDELTLRLYSKSEYADKLRTFLKIANPEMLRKVVMEPLLQALALQYDFDEEELKGAREDLENVVMPQLRALCETRARIFDEWLKERVAHLYGA